MKVRTELAAGHSHVLALPEFPPAERSVFWTEEGSDGSQPHAFMWGGSDESANFGALRTLPAGDDTTFVQTADGEFRDAKRGTLNPGGPEEDPSFPHDHLVSVLR